MLLTAGRSCRGNRNSDRKGSSAPRHAASPVVSYGIGPLEDRADPPRSAGSRRNSGFGRTGPAANQLCHPVHTAVRLAGTAVEILPRRRVVLQGRSAVPACTTALPMSFTIHSAGKRNRPRPDAIPDAGPCRLYQASHPSRIAHPSKKSPRTSAEYGVEPPRARRWPALERPRAIGSDSGGHTGCPEPSSRPRREWSAHARVRRWRGPARASRIARAPTASGSRSGGFAARGRRNAWQAKAGTCSSESGSSSGPVSSASDADFANSARCCASPVGARAPVDRPGGSSRDPGGVGAPETFPGRA